MDTTNLLIIGAVLLIFLLMIVLTGWFIWRRSRSDAQNISGPKASAPASVAPSQTAEQPASSPPVSPAASSPDTASSAGSSSAPVAAPSPLTDSASVSPQPATFPIDKFTAGVPSTPKPGGKIELMIIDDNEETIEHVTRLLYFEDDFEVVGQAIRGQQGIDMAKEKQPHVILMDINMPDMDGITATRLMAEHVPFSQVIIISVQNDPEYMKRAMLAGARDYQPKPFTADELVASIRRVYELGQSTYEKFAPEPSRGQPQADDAQGLAIIGGMNGRVVTVFSPKGGVGTSTVAANLAAVMQQQQGHVALVDANLQFGDIMVHLNTKPEHTIADLVREEGLALELLPEILQPHETGLHLLLAPPKPEMAELITPTVLSETINELRDKFTTVIIDAHNLLSNQTLAVLDNTDYIVLVTSPELPSIKNARLFLEVGQELNLTNKGMGLVVNQADKPGGIQFKQIADALKIPSAHPLPVDEHISANINSGKVISQTSAGNKFTTGIEAICQAIIEALAQAAAAAESEEPVVSEQA